MVICQGLFMRSRAASWIVRYRIGLRQARGWFVSSEECKIQESVQGFYRGPEQGRALLGLILGLKCQ